MVQSCFWKSNGQAKFFNLYSQNWFPKLDLKSILKWCYQLHGEVSSITLRPLGIIYFIYFQCLQFFACIWSLGENNIYCKEFDFICEFCARRLTATASPGRLWLGGIEFDHRRQNHILKSILPAVQLHSRGFPLFFSVLATNTTLPFRLSELLEVGREGETEQKDWTLLEACGKTPSPFDMTCNAVSFSKPSRKKILHE